MSFFFDRQCDTFRAIALTMTTQHKKTMEPAAAMVARIDGINRIRECVRIPASSQSASKSTCPSPWRPFGAHHRCQICHILIRTKQSYEKANAPNPTRNVCLLEHNLGMAWARFRYGNVHLHIHMHWNGHTRRHTYTPLRTSCLPSRRNATFEPYGRWVPAEYVSDSPKRCRLQWLFTIPSKQTSRLRNRQTARTSRLCERPHERALASRQKPALHPPRHRGSAYV